jgi:diadenosine tetraphosphate (Ap4A) HIT family hydrolase
MTLFTLSSAQPFAALKGLRCGYVQLAMTTECEQYSELDPAIWPAAQAWAAELERLGAKRVYTVVLSEQLRHLHLHLYPRWADDEPKGLALFEARDQAPQAPWSAAVTTALNHWAQAHNVALLD